jgi:hypothetical protein
MTNGLNAGHLLQIPERSKLKQRRPERSIDYRVNLEDVVTIVFGFILFGFLGTL